mmetsp:Transcript_46192/g.123746  ORF Transcript_46192/g.123746 Transcript_46192/m.123746 type:complete len:581 (+) Transcript_46192:61-1803(+)
MEDFADLYIGAPESAVAVAANDLEVRPRRRGPRRGGKKRGQQRSRSPHRSQDPSPAPAARCHDIGARSGVDRGRHAFDRTGADELEFQPHHATSVPRTVALGARHGDLAAAGEAEEQDGVTTIMLRNVPCRYTQGSLLRELDALGFADAYDFFYLPMDMRNKTSVGYAFINFLEPRSADVFLDRMQRHRFERYPSDKIPLVSPAHVQGLRRNVAHFASKAVMRARDTKYRPLVLQDGFKRDFGELAIELDLPEQGYVPRLVERSSASASALGFRGLNANAVEFVPSGALCGQAQESTSADIHRISEPELPADDCQSLCGSSLWQLPESPAEPSKPCETLEVDAAPTETSKSGVLRQARRDLENAIEAFLYHGAKPFHSISGPKSSSGSWVDEAVELLLWDLALTPSTTPKVTSYSLDADDSLVPAGDTWVARAFRSLAAESPSPLGKGSWISDAFFAMTRVATTPRGRRRLTDASGLQTASPSWVAEAFWSLAGGGERPPFACAARNEVDDAWACAVDGWVGDAFRSLVHDVGTTTTDVSCAPLTEQAAGTPRRRLASCGVGDTLGHLRSFGGWAWVAFA